jgi:hypothetical protein
MAALISKKNLLADKQKFEQLTIDIISIWIIEGYRNAANRLAIQG